MGTATFRPEDKITARYRGAGSAPFHPKVSLDGDEWSGELKSAVDRAKQGDSEAIRYLYLRFSGNVYGYAVSIVQDDHEAEDIVQQVFTRLLTAISNYDHRGVPFSAWLFRITHNMSVDHLRRRTVLCDEVRTHDESPDDRRSELSTAISSALAELPEGQREVMVLRHVAGYPPGDIAVALGKSEDAVHGLHHRGRRSVQRVLRHMEAAPTTASA